MKKLFIALSLAAFALGAQAQYQVGNSNFETTWSNNNEPGSGWYSFPSAGGDMASMGISRTKGNTTKLTGANARNNGISVRLTSKWVGLFGIGANANGNLTTGKINMGETAADNEAMTIEESFALLDEMAERLESEGGMSVFRDIELPLAYVLFDMESAGFCESVITIPFICSDSSGPSSLRRSFMKSRAFPISAFSPLM